MSLICSCVFVQAVLMIINLSCVMTGWHVHWYKYIHLMNVTLSYNKKVFVIHWSKHPILINVIMIHGAFLSCFCRKSLDYVFMIWGLAFLTIALLLHMFDQCLHVFVVLHFKMCLLHLFSCWLRVNVGSVKQSSLWVYLACHLSVVFWLWTSPSSTNFLLILGWPLHISNLVVKHPVFVTHLL